MNKSFQHKIVEKVEKSVETNFQIPYKSMFKQRLYNILYVESF